MVPKAKRIIHMCEYFLSKIEESQSIEELENSFEAFVISGRRVTYVLQKEFGGGKDSEFDQWYGKDGEGSKAKGTKQYLMRNDPYCKFFHELRNNIEKKGDNGLIYSTYIFQVDTKTDLTDKPKDCKIQISARGVYYLVKEGTSDEDLIPAKTSIEVLLTFIQIQIEGKSTNVLEACKKYLVCLKNIVNEWTGKVNKRKRDEKIR